MKNMKRSALMLLVLGGAVLVIAAHMEPADTHLTHEVASGLLGPAHAEAASQQYTCGMHPMVVTDEPGSCPICGMDLTPLKAEGSGGSDIPEGERKIKYWAAPMDPTYIRDEPGKSPMGMDLIPVYEDEAPGGAIISVDPVTSQNMGVRLATVTRRDIQRTIRTVGLVDYEEPNQYDVTTKVAGWVERLYINETGQQVKKGQALLEIYSPELVSAQEEFLLALDNHAGLTNSSFPGIAEGAKRLLESSRRRLKLWDVSSRQINRLEETRKVRKTMTLYAPYNGIVTMKMVNEGGYVKPGVRLFQIADISSVWVMADIYEYELPWVKVGQQARIILPFVGGKELSGEVSYIYPYVEPKTRTVKARIQLSNPDFELMPDMYVNIRLLTEPVQGVLTVPSEAVLHSGEKERVFVALGGGKFEPREVKVGVESDDGYIEVKGGLLTDERVVTSAQFMFDSESKLREAIQKMMEPKKPAAEHDHSTHGAAGDGDLNDLFEEDEEDGDLEDLFADEEKK